MSKLCLDKVSYLQVEHPAPAPAPAAALSPPVELPAAPAAAAAAAVLDNRQLLAVQVTPRLDHLATLTPHQPCFPTCCQGGRLPQRCAAAKDAHQSQSEPALASSGAVLRL